MADEESNVSAVVAEQESGPPSTAALSPVQAVAEEVSSSVVKKRPVDDAGDPEEGAQQANEEANEEAPPSSKKSKRASVDEDAKTNDEDQKQAENESEADDKPKRHPELTRLRKVVDEDPADFSGWTSLLQFVDSTGSSEVSLDEAREAYNDFLHRYPYCYGYWKKYADLEKRHSKDGAEGIDEDKTVAVFERGVEAISLSTELWLHYINYAREKKQQEGFEAEEQIRALYERAVAACGKEWRSDKLWDHYVKWELKLTESGGGANNASSAAADEEDQPPGSGPDELPHQSPKFVRVLQLYDRILKNETQGLLQHFAMFRDLVRDRSPKDLLEPAEFLALRREVIESLTKAKKESKSKDKEGDEDKEKAAENEDGLAAEEAPKLSPEDEAQAIMERIMAGKKKACKETEERAKARRQFEDNIKRPYFHVKPLERGQLKNWNDYLDFMIANCGPDVKVEEAAAAAASATTTTTTNKDVEILFERCLIACALYEEFWLKYVKWLEAQGWFSQAREAFKKACLHHLPEKVDIRLAWSAFEEKVGHDPAKAIEILAEVDRKHSEMGASLALRRINLERRRGNLKEVHSLFKSSLSGSSEMAIKYARFLRLSLGDDEAAAKVLEDALAEDQDNAKLWLQLLDVALHQRPLDKVKVVGVFNRVLARGDSLSYKQRAVFSQRKVDFLDDFGDSLDEVHEAEKAHLELLSSMKASAKASDENAAAANADGSPPPSGIKTIEGRGGFNRNKSAPSSNGVVHQQSYANSYGTQQANQYQQYGARYNSAQYGHHQAAAAAASYSQYSNYYQQYGGAAPGYGGHYGSY